MDSPSGSVEEEAGLEGNMPLLPAQEMVGARTQHVQLMKASFFGQKEDLNQTYSIPSPLLPVAHSSRPSSRMGEHATVRPLPHSPFPVTPSLHPHSRPSSRLGERATVRPSPHSSAYQASPFSQGGAMLHTPFQQTSTAAPSPNPPSTSLILRDQEPLDPFSQFHRPRRPPYHPLVAPQTPLQAQSALLLAKRNLRVLPPVVTRRERTLCDHGLFLGRSFRVGWGPNWTLAHSGVLVSLPAAVAKGPGVPKKGWGQGELFSSHASSRHSDDEGHPIRVVVEQVSVNSCPSICDSVSMCGVV